jgi:glycosyltransferase involved in cell wall biosynthesis
MNESDFEKRGRSLSIGFDGTCLANRRGFGRFARGILSGLVATNPGHTLEVIVDEPSKGLISLPSGVGLRTVATRRAQAESASARGNRSIGELWKMGQGVKKAGYDIFYFPSSFTYFPVWSGQKMIVTLHDTLAVDRPDLVFPTRRGRWFWWLKEHMARWNASRLTTVSEKSRSDLARYFRMQPERIGLLTEGVESTFLKSQEELPDYSSVIVTYQIPEDTIYWLYVGGLSPHKNLKRLIEAYSGLPESLGLLVIVGDFGDTFHTHLPELREAALEFGVESRVVFTGYVPDEDLASLYRNAQAVVLPSLWEGFGLPAAEAMASGVPVLHSHAGSLPEVVGDAGLAFDPTDIQDMRAKWLQLAGNETLRRELSQNGLKRSEAYRWEVAGRMLWSEFENLNVNQSKLDRRVP